MLPENILFSSDLSNDIARYLKEKKYSKLAILTDENTIHHCYPLIKTSLPEHIFIEVKSGEEKKNLKTCAEIWQQMTDLYLDRYSLMIIIGGGVLGDMGGFCAATFKRGIDFILIPTTLLAQVDASIGGKLAIDFNNFKNQIGVFQQPVLTILYSDFLKTLPFEELRSGFAEVIKHCLISSKVIWNEIRVKELKDQNWDALIKHSVEFKAQVTTQDPKEKGLRKILNAGHTLGHALESYILDTGHKIRHGEAIAAGLIMEGYIAHEKGLLGDAEFQQINTYILKIFDKVNFRESEINSIAQVATQDKKNKDNKILCVLLTEIGKAEWDIEISLEEIKRALSFYFKL